MKTKTVGIIGLCVALGLLAFAAVLAYVGWKIAGSNLGKVGGEPGLSVAGELGDARMRSMEQWCTGVLETRDDVWLVGREEHRGDPSTYAAFIPESAINLGELPGGQMRRGGFFGSRNDLTMISRLNEDGRFEVVATVPDVACLYASPEAENLYLVTWLDRPEIPEEPSVDEQGNPLAKQQPIKQRMVFRSADRGQSWEWLQQGLMANAADFQALTPVFTSDNVIWTWGEDVEERSLWSASPIDKTKLEGGYDKPTALFYSSDGGQTSYRVYADEPLLLSIEATLELLGRKDARISSRAHERQHRHIVQVSPERAYAWVAQSDWLRLPDDEAERYMLTTKATLARTGPEGRWQVEKVEHRPGRLIEHLITTPGRGTHAIVTDDGREWLMRLNTETGEWEDAQAVPQLLPNWLVDNRMWVRYFWSNGDYQVISLWGDIEVPRILFPFTEEPASITTDGHFYTRDGGRSWHQMAIPGYLGVMGLGRSDALYWSKGNWYSNEEPQLWQYRLAQ